MTDPIEAEATRFEAVQEATRRHRRQHGCAAYTFEDGAGLLALARAERAERVLELGTAIGYTACLLALATPVTRVDTIERDPEHVALARENLRLAGLEDRVTVHQGDFGTVLPTLAGCYDLVFFDGLGPSLALVERLRDLLRPGGLLVCGNLGLATSVERQALNGAFGRADRWRPTDSIEAGATRAFRNVEPGALGTRPAPPQETTR